MVSGSTQTPKNPVQTSKPPVENLFVLSALKLVIGSVQWSHCGESTLRLVEWVQSLGRSYQGVQKWPPCLALNIGVGTVRLNHLMIPGFKWMGRMWRTNLATFRMGLELRL